MFGFERITADPNILGGKACIRGMRIPVSLVVNLIANGMDVDEVIMEYPDLEPEDIRQALQYAAWTADDARCMWRSTAFQNWAVNTHVLPADLRSAHIPRSPHYSLCR
jgi:uncharacterized protein (DUF433 family)